ncbi:proton-conducting transporter transmembrane domain-containing protein [Arcticibacter eurypsychrophilus]|uniref:proton-conducting transporter transmembrane domain-containing protein n=1 Tax=Arcticibacter eurypsychrophilus TaxID=1434752 RepID=UPI00084D0A75|nr:proton-conducting transporter membrane subunit [Arcticibacter eurypsychrophilus]
MIGIYLIGAVFISLALFFNKNKTLHYSLVSLYFLLQCTLTIYEYVHLNAVQLEYFTPDALGIIFLVTLSLICGPALWHSYVYFETGKDIPRERSIYFAAMVLLLTALSAAYLSNHIAITWIFVELTTLSSSALIYHRRNLHTIEGTWKYLFVCTISITLVFIGILFLTLAIQQDGIKDLNYKVLLSQAPTLNVFWLKLSFLFVFTGFTSKASLVPMYTAGIDAKDKAPSPAGALFSSVLMNMGFVGIFRLYEIISHTSILPWTNQILLISGVLSVFVATVYMLKVKNFKRMFAYSSVEHMGLIMLGLAAGGIGYYAAILHLILHSFTKSAMFFQIGQVYRIYKSKSVYDAGDYFRYNPTGSMILLLGFFVVTAMPPSGMFVSEFLIFTALFQANHFWLLAIILLLLTMIIWSLGKTIFRMIFIKPIGFNDTDVKKIPAIESLSQLVFLGFVIYIGVNTPTVLINLIHVAIQNLPK